MNELPTLIYDELAPTRDYLQDVARIVGKLQQVFLPTDPHEWQRGLLVTEQGLSSQPFMAAGKPYQALLDLEEGMLDIGGTAWQLEHCSTQDLLKDVEIWLQAHTVKPIEAPELATTTLTFDAEQAKRLHRSIQWCNQQFQQLAAGLPENQFSPVLLFPHHFDLSLARFPHNDEQQLAIGFSTGDETIAEPYIYVTASPEPANFKSLNLPPPAYWQTDGFSGAIIRYAELATNPNPAELIHNLWTTTSGSIKNDLAE